MKVLYRYMQLSPPVIVGELAIKKAIQMLAEHCRKTAGRPLVLILEDLQTQYVSNCFTSLRDESGNCDCLPPSSVPMLARSWLFWSI